MKLPIYKRSIVGIVAVAILSIFIFFRGSKAKDDFKSVTGKITYLEKSFLNLPNTDYGKYRYIQIENYPITFEVFIGNDIGDFNPEYESIDSLNIGDIISVYFDENISSSNNTTNSLVQFIDLENTPVFVRGRKDNILGLVVLVLSCVLFLLLTYLKRKGKII
jgi:hypothetical protein